MITIGVPQHTVMRSRVSHPRSPSSISSLALWLDADDPSTITLDGSNNVETWSDKSGNARHVTQSNVTKRPSLSSLYGRTALLFDGNDDGLTASFTTIPQPVTAFAVFRLDNVDTSRWVFASLGSGMSMYVAGGGGSLGGSLYLAAWTGNAVNGMQLLAAGMPVMFCGRVNGAQSLSRRDKYPHWVGNLGASPGLVNGIMVGATQAGANVFVGVIAEIVLYARDLSHAEIRAVENYLKNKWRAP